MTRPKRYEGERLRAEQWHNMERDKAWEAKRKGMREIEPIVRGKFNLYADLKYDPVDCGYLIVIAVCHAKPPHLTGAMIYRPEDIILSLEEPALEFPSDLLKAKLIMIAG
jgi:hypothetical protein